MPYEVVLLGQNAPQGKGTKETTKGPKGPASPTKKDPPKFRGYQEGDYAALAKAIMDPKPQGPRLPTKAQREDADEMAKASAALKAAMMPSGPVLAHANKARTHIVPGKDKGKPYRSKKALAAADIERMLIDCGPEWVVSAMAQQCHVFADLIRNTPDSDPRAEANWRRWANRLLNTRF